MLMSAKRIRVSSPIRNVAGNGSSFNRDFDETLRLTFLNGPAHSAHRMFRSECTLDFKGGEPRFGGLVRERTSRIPDIPCRTAPPRTTKGFRFLFQAPLDLALP